MIWGTFGELRGVELSSDFRSLKSDVRTLQGARGFFEAPWLLERKGIYYLFYSANNRPGGLEKGCSPTLYHACIAWATADDPLGYWQYQGVLLPPVSSTTSHPGIIKYQDDWWLFYHTADGKNGGTFRRSVSRDRLYWDDSVSPARPRVNPTSTTQNEYKAPGNIAYSARVRSSSTALPIQFWVEAVNDGRVRNHPLPPELWSDEGTPEGEVPWLEYQLEYPVDVTRIRFNSISNASSLSGSKWLLKAKLAGHWQTIAKGNISVDGNWTEQFFEPVTASTFRLLFPAKNNRDELLLIQEWELY